jgi:hypothetical protein
MDLTVVATVPVLNLQHPYYGSLVILSYVLQSSPCTEHFIVTRTHPSLLCHLPTQMAHLAQRQDQGLEIGRPISFQKLFSGETPQVECPKTQPLPTIDPLRGFSAIIRIPLSTRPGQIDILAVSKRNEPHVICKYLDHFSTVLLQVKCNLAELFEVDFMEMLYNMIRYLFGKV